MTRLPARFRAAIALALAVPLVGASAYTFRDTLASLPLVGALLADAQAPAAAPVYVCPMHPDVRSHAPGRCPQCGMELVLEDPATAEQAHAAAHGAHAEAASPASAAVATTGAVALPSEPRAPVTLDARRRQILGIRTVLAARAPLARQVRATGLLKADETRYTDVTLKIDGWVEDLFVDYTGRAVRKGERLFTLYSPELVAAQREYILAARARDHAHAGTVAAARALADGLLAAARDRLRLWDLTEEQIARLEQSGEPARTVTFYAPASGVVLEKTVVKGSRVMAGQTLFRLVDLSRLWLEADVYERELSVLGKGARSVVTLEAFPGEAFDATLTFVWPLVDQATRTVRARFELPNPGARLKPGMFATVAIAEPTRNVLAIPADALLDTGVRQIVFVAEGEGYYAPRDVQVGARVDGHVEILGGLSDGERIAASALFFLDSESQIRGALEGYAPGPPVEAAAPATAALSIDLTSQPDPPRAGRTTFIVTVADSNGQPVADAEVTLALYMPPMPSMNMPAMRSDGRLVPAGGGIYRGEIDVLMNGRWDATVTVTRDGARLGARQLTLVVR
ncbi:MAG: FixH family protein [Acidobacteriota bacterium]